MRLRRLRLVVIPIERILGAFSSLYRNSGYLGGLVRGSIAEMRGMWNAVGLLRLAGLFENSDHLVVVTLNSEHECRLAIFVFCLQVCACADQHAANLVVAETCSFE